MENKKFRTHPYPVKSLHPNGMCVYTVKRVLNGPFIKGNFVLNGNIFRSHDYHSIPWLNGNLASAETFSGPLRFLLRQVLLYIYLCLDYIYKHCFDGYFWSPFAFMSSYLTSFSLEMRKLWGCSVMSRLYRSKKNLKLTALALIWLQLEKTK
jgi:hypothetical protein